MRNDPQENVNHRALLMAGICVVSVLATLAAIRLVSALSRESTGPASGTRVSGPVAATRPILPGELRVALFNIRRGVGTDGYRDVARIVRQLQTNPPAPSQTSTSVSGLLRTRIGLPLAPQFDLLPPSGFDLIALNEVDGDEPGFPNQAAAIAMPLELQYLDAPAELIYGRPNIGSAVLARLPVAHWQRVPMRKTRPNGYRNYVLVRMSLGEGRWVNAIVTHLDGSEDRDAQLRLVTQLFLSLEPPALLIGDFNTTADHPVLRELLRRPDVVEPFERLGLSVPPKRIDWIVARGFDALGAGREDLGNSDHALWWVRLRVK